MTDGIGTTGLPRRARYSVYAGFLVATLGVSFPALADWEVGSYWVNDYDGVASCWTADDLSYADDCGIYFRQHLMSAYSYDYWVQQSNANAKSLRFADIDQWQEGRDHSAGSPNYGVDIVDIFMFYGHGRWWDAHPSDAGSILISGGLTTGFCQVAWGTPLRNYAEWGDSDLNVVVMETCNSLQEEILDAYFYYQYSTSGHGDKFMTGNAGMLLGYHGFSYDNSQHTGDFKDWVDDSEFDNLGDNFVDYNSRFPSGSNNDTCAAAVTYGTTSSDRSLIYQASGFKDWVNVTTHTGMTYWVLGNCDPFDGQET